MAKFLLGRNPLTGKHLLQRQPLRNSVLEGMLRRGFSEKDEVWNMHTPYKGHFWGFMLLGRRMGNGR